MKSDAHTDENRNNKKSGRAGCVSIPSWQEQQSTFISIGCLQIDHEIQSYGEVEAAKKFMDALRRIKIVFAPAT